MPKPCRSPFGVACGPLIFGLTSRHKRRTTLLSDSSPKAGLEGDAAFFSDSDGLKGCASFDPAKAGRISVLATLGSRTRNTTAHELRHLWQARRWNAEASPQGAARMTPGLQQAYEYDARA